MSNSMKILLLFFTYILLNNSLFSQAPSYTNWEWDVVRIGVSNISNAGANRTGFLVETEVRYNISDLYSIGYSQGSSLFIYNRNNENYDMIQNSHISLVSDYYFKGNSANRAFLGIGIGLYLWQAFEVRNGDPFRSNNSRLSVGLSPRVGYEFNHFRTMLEYHHAFKEGVGRLYNLTFAATLWGAYKPKQITLPYPN